MTYSVQGWTPSSSLQIKSQSRMMLMALQRTAPRKLRMDPTPAQAIQHRCKVQNQRATEFTHLFLLHLLCPLQGTLARELTIQFSMTTLDVGK
ncbi:C protein [Orthorubulavirus mapueraense]|uniref:C protein n=1 Tax=Orthorubulavirus mapueraense TaxID=3052559 RepID=A3R043_9MONO|nr:C protein [Orthorubulavirus mapueraense]ABL84842.1 C protein [Orthorubulavirus mapueraense]